jgi:hypothetical protein
MQDWKKEYSKTFLIQSARDKKKGPFQITWFFHRKHISYVVVGTDVCKLWFFYLTEKLEVFLCIFNFLKCKLPNLIQFISKCKPTNSDSCLSNVVCSLLFLKVRTQVTFALEVPSVKKKKGWLHELCRKHYNSPHWFLCQCQSFVIFFIRLQPLRHSFSFNVVISIRWI